MENKFVDFSIKPNPFRAPRRLTIASDYLQFEDKSSIADPFTRFEKSDITDFRYGVRWIYGFRFTIGREYHIYVRNKNNELIKIYFGALYGYKKTEQFNLYKGIIAALWEHYFEDKVREMMHECNENGTVEVCGVSLSNKSIIIKKEGVFKATEYVIPWDKAGVRNYKTHFVIYSAEDPTNINKAFNYRDEWNAAVLYAVINSTIK